MGNYPINPIFKRLTAVGLILFGVALVLVLPNINSQTGPDFSNPLTKIGFGIAITGWFIITYAWITGTRKGWIPLEPKLGEPRLRQQRKLSWLFSFCLAALYGFWAWQSWNNPDASAFPIWIAILWLPMLMFASGKHSIERALEARGGYPQDERERDILRTATFYAFYAAVIMLGATATILNMAPPPSKFALNTLFLADILILFSVRDFIAWRMGLK